jgi:glycosyltransferase involved in cell wall biosynthesis
MWAAPNRQADREQSVQTAAALARAGNEVTLLLPRRADDQTVTAADLASFFAVDAPFSVVQRASRWVGEQVVPSSLWLRQVHADPLTRAADVLFSRIPAQLAAGGLSPVPFAADHYRPWPDRWPILRPAIRRTARAPHCLGFVLHSAFAADSFLRLPISPDRVLVAHNGADPALMAAPLSQHAARVALGLPADRRIVVYAGRVNERKGLDRLLEVADLRPDTLFVLVGSEGTGPVEAAAARRANVQVEPWQLPAALPPWLYAADVLVIPPTHAPLQHGSCVLPIKTFGYLAAGRAILAPVSPDTAELLRHEDTALLVPADDPSAAAAALDRLQGEPALGNRLAANAQALAATLTWDARAKRIGDFLARRLDEVPRQALREGARQPA